MKFFEHIGSYFLFLGSVFLPPKRWKIFYRQVVESMYTLGIQSISIISVMSLFVGGAIAIHTAYNLMELPSYVIGFTTREALILEFCSTMLALILSGKVGSNIASEIGTMKITEQIDAMELMGVNAASYLALPKIVGLILMSPFITVLSIFMGMVGGLVSMAVTDYITVAQYVEGLQFEAHPYYVVYSVIKSVFFIFIITSVSAFCGYNVKHSTLDVGRNSTRAVVVSSNLILIFNLILTQLLL
jgi:phospholipid/cholesterol/gamma-HCH transport system permease protein